MSDLPLFPLDVVVFPGMTVPLYIFEERYKALVRRALADEEGRFAVVLETGGAEIRDSGPALPAHGALVTILAANENPDGTLQLLTHGQERCRVRIVRTEHIDELDGQPRPLYFTADEPAPIGRGDPNEERLAAWDALDTFRAYAAAFFEADALRQIDEALPDDLLYQASFVCANIRVPLASRQVMLDAPTLIERFQLAKKLMDERLAGDGGADVRIAE